MRASPVAVVLPFSKAVLNLRIVQVYARIELDLVGLLRSLDFPFRWGDPGRMGRNLVPYSISFSWTLRPFKDRAHMGTSASAPQTIDTLAFEP